MRDCNSDEADDINCSVTAFFVALIPLIRTGRRIGKDKIVNKAPLAPALEIIAATIVPPAANPKLPKNITRINKTGLTISKFITAINRGIVIISIVNSRKRLKNNLPINTLVAGATNLSVSAVCVSSSRTKICERPDIDEKNRIIQSKAERISLSAEKAPIENDTAVRVTTLNNRMALTA